jgi:CheY-like chemotaxis protein
VSKRAELRLTGIDVLVVGASVVIAGSGAEALAALSYIRAHVIVSDLSMPGMTGIDFIRLVRALPGEAEKPTPAIAVTAFDDPVNPMTVIEEVERLYHTAQAS